MNLTTREQFEQLKLSKLKACPMCAETPLLSYNAGNENYGQRWWVQCKCGLTGPGFWGSNIWYVQLEEDIDAVSRAIKHWNTRRSKKR